MHNLCKRKFEKGQEIYLIDYWKVGNIAQVLATKAKIFWVDEKKQRLMLELYGNTYKVYGFTDYKRLFFDTQEEVEEGIKRLPKLQATVYQLVDKWVVKKTVVGISGKLNSGTADIVICLSRGKPVPISELNRTLFFNESDARKKLRESLNI